MPYYNRDPKRDHNFDNHPYVGWMRGLCVSELGSWSCKVGEVAVLEASERCCKAFIKYGDCRIRDLGLRVWGLVLWTGFRVWASDSRSKIRFMKSATTRMLEIHFSAGIELRHTAGSVAFVHWSMPKQHREPGSF